LISGESLAKGKAKKISGKLGKIMGGGRDNTGTTQTGKCTGLVGKSKRRIQYSLEWQRVRKVVGGSTGNAGIMRESQLAKREPTVTGMTTLEAPHQTLESKAHWFGSRGWENRGKKCTDVDDMVLRQPGTLGGGDGETLNDRTF